MEEEEIKKLADCLKNLAGKLSSKDTGIPVEYIQGALDGLAEGILLRVKEN